MSQMYCKTDFAFTVVSDDLTQMYLSVLHLKCCKHQEWIACLTRGKKYSEPERTCIQIKDNFVMLSVVCLTACLCLLCRWRWMQTISAIAHAPKVSARIHTHSHRRQRHSGWPSLPQRKHTCTAANTHIYCTHTTAQIPLCHTRVVFFHCSLSFPICLFSYLAKPESQSPHFRSFVLIH